MADNQLLLKKNADDDFFADDDPLAELARIIGFESPVDTKPRPSVARHEPEFDLEDELLKEFEQYEAPERVEAQPVEALALPNGLQPVQVENDALVARLPDVATPADDAPVADDAAEVQQAAVALHGDDFLTAAPVVADPVRASAHPVFELEDEILREFAAFDISRSGDDREDVPEVTPPVVIAPAASHASVDLVDQLIAEFAPQVDDRAVSVADTNSQMRAPESDDLSSAYALPDPFAEDLSEQNSDASDEAVFAEQWQRANEDAFIGHQGESPVSDFDEFIEQPARSHADVYGDRSWEDAPALQTVIRPPVTGDRMIAAHEAAIDTDSIESQLRESLWTEPAVVAPVRAEVAQEVLPDQNDYLPPLASDRFDELDALLGEDVKDAAPAPTLPWSRSTPVAMDRDLASSAPSLDARASVAPEPLVAAPSFAPAQTAAPEVFETDRVLAAGAEQDADEIVIDPFDEGAFELDLSEIELDLLEVETLSDPVARQDAVVASAEAMQVMAREPVIDRGAFHKSAEPTAVVRPPVEDYSALPFDPTQITSEEDPVETIADLDVPEILQEHHASAIPAAQPDYDIDIDAEMAHLFNRSAGATTRPPATAADPVAKQAVPASSPPMTDLDDFERALEEDFRKSMTENRAVSSPDRVALSPGGFPIEAAERSSSRRIMLMAASVAAIAVLGSAGVYAFLGGEGDMLQTATEPKIILADKDPVKMVPEDKGGQQVPNQDKAVYDRVSGEQPEQSKQERLLTSNEEPVDVVQKTLMPETLPMDDEGGANITPTDDTADARLLPTNVDKDNVTTSEKVTSGVAPRKVRTMVVRADGTLVAREEPAPEDVPAKTAEVPAQQDVARVDPVVPERLAESASDSIASQINAAEASTPAADVKAAEPVVEKTPVVPVEAPVAAEEPVKAQQPITNADIQPITAQDTPAQADLPAEAQADSTQAAIADAANADVDAPVRSVKTTKIVNTDTPIPENRPVDQPVDIVGRVTDKGNVRPVADDSQQVAAADAAAQPEKATAVPAGSYVIQIASLPSEADAQNSYAKLSAKFASVIGGRGVDIKRAEIKNKGTYYRVRIPAGSRQEAAALCDRYKQAGGSCLVSR